MHATNILKFTSVVMEQLYVVIEGSHGSMYKIFGKTTMKYLRFDIGQPKYLQLLWYSHLTF